MCYLLLLILCLCTVVLSLFVLALLCFIKVISIDTVKLGFACLSCLLAVAVGPTGYACDEVVQR